MILYYILDILGIILRDCGFNLNLCSRPPLIPHWQGLLGAILLLSGGSGSLSFLFSLLWHPRGVPPHCWAGLGRRGIFFLMHLVSKIYLPYFFRLLLFLNRFNLLDILCYINQGYGIINWDMSFML